MSRCTRRTSRRPGGLVLVLVVLVALGLAAQGPAGAIPKDDDNGDARPPRTTTTRRPTTTTTQAPGPPRYRTEAVSFHVVEESSIDWPGSDEPLWTFNTMSGDGQTRSVSQEFGDADEGETHHFGPRCLVADCVNGVVGPINLHAVAVETDVAGHDGAHYEGAVRDAINEVCGWADHPDKCRAVELFAGYIVGRIGSWLGDDHVGNLNIHWPLSDLAGLPAPGASSDEQITFSNGGETVYRLTVRTTRVS